MARGRANIYIHLNWLRIDSDTSPLARFNDGYGYVNSTKVLNAIRNSLGVVHNYRLAVIKKTMQAVTFQLSTYSWVFDIVPAVGVSNGTGGTAHYLIPDGRGNWIRTDPRIDQSNLTTVNQRHTNYFIPTLRLLKYWNMKRSRRRLPSYYFETLAMRVFEYATPIRSYSDAIDYFFRQCPIYLALSCPDPKGLGPALDSGIDITTRQAVKDSMSSASGATGAAMLSSRLGDEKAAIGHWGRVFGAEFPTYG